MAPPGGGSTWLRWVVKHVAPQWVKHVAPLGCEARGSALGEARGSIRGVVQRRDACDINIANNEEHVVFAPKQDPSPQPLVAAAIEIVTVDD